MLTIQSYSRLWSSLLAEGAGAVRAAVLSRPRDLQDRRCVINNKKDITVIKTWIGGLEKEITVRLYADGKEITKASITEASGWKTTFRDLSIYTDAGDKICYTLSEDEVAGFSSKIGGDDEKGFIVTNTHNTHSTEETPTTPTTKATPQAGDTGTALKSIFFISLLIALIILGIKAK